MEDASAALRALASGRTVGKVVLAAPAHAPTALRGRWAVVGGTGGGLS